MATIIRELKSAFSKLPYIRSLVDQRNQLLEERNQLLEERNQLRENRDRFLGLSTLTEESVLCHESMIRKLEQKTARAEQESVFKEYAKLQITWNSDVLDCLYKYIGTTPLEKMISLGPFLGLLEGVLAQVFREVHVCDLENHLFDPPSNLVYHRMNLDSCDWELPDERFDLCLMIELIEHLLWSPMPLLNWVKLHCGILVLTTPDDKEWPPLPPLPWVRHQHISHVPPPFPGCQSNPQVMHHCKQYTLAEIMELLEKTGFRLLEFQRIGDGKHQMLCVCAPR